VRAGKRSSFRGKGTVQNFFADTYRLSGSERGKRSNSSCEGTLQRQRKMRDQLFCAKSSAGKIHNPGPIYFPNHEGSALGACLVGASPLATGSFGLSWFFLQTGLWSRPPLACGGQFLCGVAGGQQTGSRASPVCHLRIGPCLDQVLAGSSLSPMGLRESQPPTVHG
jgi:hypothetical protein